MTTKDLLTTNYLELLLWIFRRRKRFRVTGNSMLPLLQPNEEILVDPAGYQKSLPKVLDLVIVAHPQQPGLILVKRIVAIDEEYNCFLVGDNLAESKDSRHWGAINATRLLGKVTSRFV